MIPKALAVSLLFTAPGAVAAGAANDALALDVAQRLAAERSPSLAAAAARVRAAEAELLGARVYPLNPEIEGARTRRESGVERTNDREIALSQGIELGGQRGKRTAVAEAALAAERSRFERSRQELAALVESRFAEALAARELVRLAEVERRIAAELAAFEARRLEAGASTQIELNLALAVEGRAERSLELAASAEIAARARLAEAIGLPPDDLSALAGDPSAVGQPSETLVELERTALVKRPDLVASRHESATAAAQVRLERSAAIPDLTLGLGVGREEVTDDLTTLSAGFSIPLFDRNQGGIAAARAAESEASADVAALELAVRREVTEAHSRLAAAVRGRVALAERVEGTLEESLQLLEKALAAGKLRASEVLVFRRELVDSRRELIDASLEAWLARVELDLAVGRIDVPAVSPNPTSAELTR